MSIGFKQQLLTRQISDLYPNSNDSAPKEVTATTTYKRSVYTIVPSPERQTLMATRHFGPQSALDSLTKNKI